MAIADLTKQNVEIESGLLAPDDLSITGDGHVKLEENVMCGQKVQLIAERRDVLIGARAWLGDNTIVRANVGANSIVTTNSVVLQDVPDNVVVNGNPATKIWQIC